jgi:CheY-like chemotaxis protein
MSSSTGKRLLLIEDNSADVEAIRRAVNGSQMAIEYDLLTDGVEVKRVINDERSEFKPEKFDLILLDLNLPGVDGRSLLSEFKDTAGWKQIPIVILTTSNNSDDATIAYRNGANAFVVKPGSHNEFIDTVQSVLDFWLCGL